ncbi:TetR/AcrR family transcriptional regulator [Sphingomonas profundi]|uniref:TetR/AcrR family transcriptional regulator n=1 Tax=Alterirhizorhabdus profundi TaxID=2681549 RepID=UPI0018D1F02E|nr:TetR/AcrR family transcriptional regulator [Sphingomonas profundi]
MTTRAAGQARTLLTQRTLLTVAERLFAERGIDNVSLRQIADAAGMVSNNVVRYHFSTRENLIAELLQWRVRSLEPVRTAMLKDADARGVSHDIRTLMMILCAPLLAIRDEDGGLGFALFLSRYMFSLRGQGIPHPYDLDAGSVPALTETLARIDRRLYFLPAGTIEVRKRTGLGMFLNNISFLASSAGPNRPVLISDPMVADLMEMITAAMLAPPAAICEDQPKAFSQDQKPV